jgi:hypothetical protein
MYPGKGISVRIYLVIGAPTYSSELVGHAPLAPFTMSMGSPNRSSAFSATAEFLGSGRRVATPCDRSAGVSLT